MDHVVFLDSQSKELENLIRGNKSMIICGAPGKKVPHGQVHKGDILYLINSHNDSEVKARAIVASVLNSDKLSEEESYETIIRHQDKLQLPDKQFEKLAGNPFLVLIELNDIREIEPFHIDKCNSQNLECWLPVGKIENVVIDNTHIRIN